MRRRDGANALRGRLVIEQHVSAPVHLQVDESGRKPCTLGQHMRGNASRQLRRRYEFEDARAVHYRGTLAHERAVEDMVGCDRVQRRFVHRVRVIFCRCRGRSMRVPRRRARRMASP